MENRAFVHMLHTLVLWRDLLRADLVVMQNTANLAKL